MVEVLQLETLTEQHIQLDIEEIHRHTLVIIHKRSFLQIQDLQGVSDYIVTRFLVSHHQLVVVEVDYILMKTQLDKRHHLLQRMQLQLVASQSHLLEIIIKNFLIKMILIIIIGMVTHQLLLIVFMVFKKDFQVMMNH